MDRATSEFNRSKGRVAEEFNSLAGVAEDLLLNTATKAGEGIDKVGAKLQDTLNTSANSILAAEQALVEKTKYAATATNNYVQGNPWSAVGVASTIGLVIGLLIAKR